MMKTNLRRYVQFIVSLMNGLKKAFISFQSPILRTNGYEWLPMELDHLLSESEFIVSRLNSPAFGMKARSGAILQWNGYEKNETSIPAHCLSSVEETTMASNFTGHRVHIHFGREALEAWRN